MLIEFETCDGCGQYKEVCKCNELNSADEREGE